MSITAKKAMISLLGVLAAAGGPAWGQGAADLQGSVAPAHSLWVETLDLSAITQGYGSPHAGKSVDGNALTLGGTVYPHGIGTHALSELRIALHGGAKRFTAMVGIDGEETNRGSATFSVIVDKKTAAQTGVLHASDAPQLLSVDLTGAQTLILAVGDGGDGNSYDHADWGGAMLTLAEGAAKPEAFVLPVAPPRIVLLPPNPRPAFHGPRIVGATPGHPFLFLVPATGDGPLTYSAKNLPAGLTLDPKNGILSGRLARAGRTPVLLTVRGPKGTAKRTLTIVGGVHQLALTPPMGWNSWNVWAGNVDADKVRAAADEMLSTGLARYGFQFINIDDTWEAGRDPQGNIQTNAKFPNMKLLSDYIHGQGLKMGIYSSPGPTTCGGYTASYQHEAQDARTYAGWGVDYLKYDWCSYGEIARGDNSLPTLQKPYTLMGNALAQTNRDIVYSFCQYGMGDVWKWGAQTGGNCWRTQGDIEDNWGSLHGIYEREAGHGPYAGPGHWNDPDMLMVGVVGKGNTHPTHLTPNEQVLHISLWCLVSSPLLIGCDMTKLDPFTLALLSNDEALDIDQDPLGKAADRVAQNAAGGEVWARPLADGTHAVGLVNGGDDPAVVTARWTDIGVAGRQSVRDLWLHKNVGSYTGSYGVLVPAHGCVLLKVGTPKSAA